MTRLVLLVVALYGLVARDRFDFAAGVAATLLVVWIEGLLRTAEGEGGG